MCASSSLGDTGYQWLSLLTTTLSSLHIRKELRMESSWVQGVLKFMEEILDAMKREDNQNEMAIFFTTTIGFGLQ